MVFYLEEDGRLREVLPGQVLRLPSRGDDALKTVDIGPITFHEKRVVLDYRLDRARRKVELVNRLLLTVKGDYDESVAWDLLIQEVKERNRILLERGALG
jgi:hypothetical protein